MLSKTQQKKIAKERIEILLEEAKKAFKNAPELSKRYISLARKISMKVKVQIPQEYKKLFCKKCHNFLQPGKTLRARVRNKVLVYYCKNCETIKRYPLK